MLFTVDLLVLQEETLGLAGTLEVVVGSVPACTTPHGHTHLTTHITMLEGKTAPWFKAQYIKKNRRDCTLYVRMQESMCNGFS